MGFDISRRKLIGGIGLLVAARAIVRASSLMPVKRIPGYHHITLQELADRWQERWASELAKVYYDMMVYGEGRVMVGPEEVRHISVAHTQIARWSIDRTAAGESAA